MFQRNRLIRPDFLIISGDDLGCNLLNLNVGMIHVEGMLSAQNYCTAKRIWVSSCNYWLGREILKTFVYFPLFYIGFSTYSCHKAPAVEHGIASADHHWHSNIFYSISVFSATSGLLGTIGSPCKKTHTSLYSYFFFIFSYASSSTPHTRQWLSRW